MVPAGSWEQVYAACRKNGGDLASIHSQEEAAQASQACPYQFCYIGLKRHKNPVEEEEEEEEEKEKEALGAG